MARIYSALVLKVLDERTLLLRIYLELGHTETMPVRLRWLHSSGEGEDGGRRALAEFVSSKVLDTLVDVEIHKVLTLNSCLDKAYAGLNDLLAAAGYGIAKPHHCEACDNRGGPCHNLAIAEASIYFWADCVDRLCLEAASVEAGVGKIIMRGSDEVIGNGGTSPRRRAND